MGDFNKGVGEFISKERADRLKANWKRTTIKTNSSFLGSDKLREMLNTPGVVGLRIHYGIDDEGNMSPMITAEKGDDREASIKDGDDGPTLDASLPCPPYCGG